MEPKKRGRPPKKRPEPVEEDKWTVFVREKLVYMRNCLYWIESPDTTPARFRQVIGALQRHCEDLLNNQQ